MSGAAPDDRCPRCGGAFHCGADDAVPCACSTVRLDTATLARLRQQFSGCLCVACLHAIAAGEPLRPAASAGAEAEAP